MRIVHLVSTLDYGGAEQVVASLAQTQGRQGDAVIVVCLRGLGAHPVDLSAAEAAGVRVVTLDKPDGFRLGALYRLRDLLRDEAADVIHSHNHLVAHYAVAAARFAGTPAIVNTMHGTASLLATSIWVRGLYCGSGLWSDRVVCVSAPVDTVLRERCRVLSGKLCVIDNGIDLSRFLAITPRQPSPAVTFGTIGRLDPVKDHETLLRAFELVLRDYPNARLRLLGDGEMGARLKQLARALAIEPAVDFEGFSLDTPRFLAGIDAYVISSRSEGLPLTLLEAMAASLPVVATAVGGIPDVLRRAGCDWTCPPGDPAQLAAAMGRVLRASDRDAIGARNRRTAVEYYSVERMAHDYRSLYESLVARRGSPRRAETHR